MRKTIFLITMATIFFFAMSCSLPTLKEDLGTTVSGSLSLSVSPVAPWLQDFINSDSRAILYSTQVKVEIQDSSNVDVIPPLIIPLSMNGQGGSTTLDNITDIPSGYGYTLIVSLFNSAVSTTDPVVSGQETINIYENQITIAEVTCFPVSPQNIVADSGPWTSPLPMEAEMWYSISMSTGTIYTFNQSTADMGTFLFGKDGFLISAINPGTAYEYTCPSSGTYFVGVAAVSAGSSSLDITAYTPPLNEGSAAAPVNITLDTARTFQIGNINSGQSNSYYSFTTSEAGTYYFDSDLTTSSSLNIYLYSDSAYSNLISSDTYAPYGAEFDSLAASTTYYIRLYDSSSSYNFSFPAKVVSPGAVQAGFAGEGSLSTPVGISIDNVYSGQVGNHVYDQYSYYTFTTGSGIDYTIDFDNISQNIYYYLYSDSGFSTQVASKSMSSGYPYSTLFQLIPNTTYYLKVKNNRMSNDLAGIYDLSVNEITAVITPLSLSTMTIGTLSAVTPVYWYRIPVTEGLPYSIMWDDSFNGSGSYTCDVKVSVYQSDRLTSYFVNDDSGYSNPSTITVSPGESEIFVKVVPFSSGTGTFGLKVEPSEGSLTVTVQ